MKVLFVCTGNICRSPLAERLAAEYAHRRSIPDFDASSAGTQAVVGHGIHPDAATVLEALGGDSSDFAARQLTAQIASSADLVVTMTRSHRDAVLQLAPRQFRRTFTLSEAARLISDCGAEGIADLAELRPRLNRQAAPDIADPIGEDSEFHGMVGTQIAGLLPPILEVCRPGRANR